MNIKNRIVRPTRPKKRLYTVSLEHLTAEDVSYSQVHRAPGGGCRSLRPSGHISHEQGEDKPEQA
jgi:hypothetical protein